MQKNSISPSYKRSPFANPWSILPVPTQLLVDLYVVEVCGWVEPLKSTAWFQNATSILPPQNAPKLQFSPRKNKAAMQSPHRFLLGDHNYWVQ
jgi:hypothetical protein